MKINLRGRMRYVPPVVELELEDIKREERVMSNADAFKKLVGYARDGRELNRIGKLSWKNKKRLPPINDFYRGVL